MNIVRSTNVSLQQNSNDYCFITHGSGNSYCNVDDKAMLSNDPVKQQWKGSDRCYAMAQYTGVNNGVEDVFCVVGVAVICISE
jgi:hypothetical protein